jgi:hypothetical protein
MIEHKVIRGIRRGERSVCAERLLTTLSLVAVLPIAAQSSRGE